MATQRASLSAGKVDPGGAMRLIALFFALLALPAASQAAWLEAASENFVVYADDSERDIELLSRQLESYHRAMEIITGVETGTPSPSGRVTVFVVRNEREVKRLFGEGSRFVGGFYIPRAGGSLAIIPSVRMSSRRTHYSMIVLLHEYAHHFLISNSRFPQPRWVSEGGAEFFASAEFDRDGGIKIGMPAVHRAGELWYANEVRAEELLDPDVYEQRRRRGYDAFYGRSWLLYHYLTFNEERAGQLRQYLADMAAGKSSREAAEAIFGDFDQLDRELDRYMRQRMLSWVIPADRVASGPVAIRQLREGEAEMMPVRIRSRRGVTQEQAEELLVDARKIAAKHPDDPAVLAALAEAEFDAGNDEEAIAAADRAIELDPAEVNAYVQKGYALFRRAADAEDQAAAYREAIAPFVALNRIENDHPLPLVYFHRSFTARGEQPTELAEHGLERAVELAPFDLGLRFEVALQHLRAERIAQAHYDLRPVAYNPHGGEMASVARGMIEVLDAARETGGEAGRVALEMLDSMREAAATAAADGDGSSDGSGDDTDGADPADDGEDA